MELLHGVRYSRVVNDMAEINVTPVDLPDISLTVSSAGVGPAVVLLHGFPEIAYSWRHQIPVLAEAGYHVLAPDQRGYGWSDQPEGVASYAMTELVGDVIGLLDHHEIDDAVIVGHDWGALIAPWVGLFRPDRVRGIALLSVPYTPRGDRSIVEHVRETDPGGDFAYILAFQEAGIEDLLEADPIETLRRTHWSLCGARPNDLQPGDPLPAGLPPYLSQGEFENYYRAFTRSGFANPINYYRNLHQNWEAGRPWANAKLTMPVTFIAGEKDFVVTSGDGELGSSVQQMNDWCTDLRDIHLIPDAGHWVQQEAPDQVNELLVDFVNSVTP